MVPAINECTSYSLHMLWPSETALREANEKTPMERPICTEGLPLATPSKQIHETISERPRIAICTVVYGYILELGQTDQSTTISLYCAKITPN